MTLEFRALTVDELDAMQDVRVRAFGPMSSAGVAMWRAVNAELCEQGRNYGVLADGVLAAAGKARGFEQAWHGRLVPMAGMAGITVLPEFRGRGVGTHLMRGLAQESVARGEPVSALFPATVPLYRNLGWELVGGQSRFALPAHQLRTLGGSAALGRVGQDDIATVRALCRSGLETDRVSGPLWWSDSQWDRQLRREGTFVYAAQDGMVVYSWRGDDLIVDFLWAASEDTARSLWSLVGSGSSVAKTVFAHLSPDDPVFWMLPEEAAHETVRHGWMLRVLDVPGAIAARGYATDGSVTIALDDPQSAANTGVWRLVVDGGVGVAERCDEPVDLTVTARGLAALYAGRPAAGLRRAGLLRSSSPGVEARLDRLFATSAPYLTDYF